MSAREIATLAVRLLALYTAVLAARALGDAFELGAIPSLSALQFTVLTVRPAVLLAAAALLWSQAPGIARGMGPERRSPRAPATDIRALADLAFAVVGLAFAVPAVGGLVQYLASLPVHASSPIPGSQTALMWSSVVEIVLGAALFLGRRGLVKLFWTMKAS